MSTFFLQSALLIAVTYFLGAIVGCWLRKLFRQSASMLHTETVGAGTAVAGAAVAGAGAGAVLGNQYAGAEGEASIEINRPDPEPIAPRKIYIEEIPESLASEPTVLPQPEPVTYIEAEATPVSEPEAAAPVIPASILEPEPEIEIIEPEIREQVFIHEDIVPVVPEVETVPVVAAPPVVDDLTRIKGVGLPVALELKKIGVLRFEQVARWTDADVAHVSRQLGFSGRIERENWMDQARILAAGDELEFTTHQLARAERDNRSEIDREHQGQGERKPRDQKKPEADRTVRPSETFMRASRTDRSASSTQRTSLGDLKLIIGIDTNMAEKLNAIGINRLEQVANWTPSEIEALERQLGAQDRITRERWVQQARHLMS